MKRIMIAGTNSGCGKTTVTCAVLQSLVNRGYDTAAFKCGPDYIDPMFHSRIIGARSRNLDGWFCGKNTLNYLLDKNSGDISVIEGVMGYYDGVGDKASSYRMSQDTGTPAVIVIDCKGMSTSIGAVMKGFLTYREPCGIAGFIFNRLPESLIDTAKKLCREMHTEYLGRLPYSKECAVESRHLGLVTADEIADLKSRMHKLSQLAEENLLLDRLIAIAGKAEDISFTPPVIAPISGRRIKIAAAFDSAFCFYYEDNFDMLRELGCEIVKFSPLNDNRLPDDISGLIIGGGYPELYARKLSENISMRADIRRAVKSGLPVIAECGGFMYLHDTMEDTNGNLYEMAGAIEGKAYKTEKLRRFGYVSLTARNDNLLCGKGEKIAAHEFHYWDSTLCGSGFYAKKARGGAGYECAHAGPSIYAGFPHLYFYANPEIAVNFVKKCEGFRG